MNYYQCQEDKHILDKVKKDRSIKFTLSNSQYIHSTDKGILSISYYLSKVSHKLQSYYSKQAHY